MISSAVKVLGLILLLAVGLVLYVLALVLKTAWMLAHPPRRSTAWALARSLPSDPGELPEPLEWSEWSFASRGVTLPAWDIAGRDPSGPVVVLTHGWGDSRVVGLPRAAGLAARASRLIAWEMPGHGQAPGSCALGLREHEDLLALIDAIGQTDRPIVLAGFSLGAGVSIEAAAVISSTGGTPVPHKDMVRVAGVIAEAPYRFPMTPARRVLISRGYPHTVNLRPAMGLVGLVRTGTPFTAARFDRVKHAARINVPLLVLHGENDTISPVEDGRAIAAAAPDGLGRFVEIAEAGHADVWTNPRSRETAQEAVRTFLLSRAM